MENEKKVAKKKPKYEKNGNAKFSKFLSSGVKFEVKIAKNRSCQYFT